MNYIRSGTFKKGTATNVDQGVSVDIAGLGGSTAIYTATSADSTLTGTANGEVIAYFLKLGGLGAYRLIDITQIDAGGGNDLVDLTNAANPYALDVTIDGGEGNDTLWAGSGSDDISGSDGTDSLWGGGGGDSLVGGDGSDTLSGAAGNDVLISGSIPEYGSIVYYMGDNDFHPDQLDGGSGDDTLYGTLEDTLSGGAGNDDLYVVLYEPTEDDYYDFYFFGNIYGGEGYDSIRAGNLVIGVANFSGPSYGIERIWLDNHSERFPSVVEAYWDLSGVDWDFSSVDFLDMGDFYLTDGNDRIVCPASSDDHVYVFGYYGNDTIVGGPIDEALFGDWGDPWSHARDGNDIISGGAGNDKIVPDGGADALSGGTGDDEFFFVGAFGNDHILDFEQGADSSTGDKIYLDYDANFSDLEPLISQNGANTFVIDLTSLGGGVLEVAGSGTLTELKETDFFFGGFYHFA